MEKESQKGKTFETWYYKDEMENTWDENNMGGWTEYKHFKRTYYKNKPEGDSESIKVEIFVLNKDNFFKFSPHQHYKDLGYITNPKMELFYTTIKSF